MSEGSPFEPRPSFPAGARCATHPEREAQRTCVRCGNYMCGECISASGSGMCLSCASRTGTGGSFPFSRDNYTFDGLLNYALARWKQCWLPLALATAAWLFVIYVPVFVVGLASVPFRDPSSVRTAFGIAGVQIGAQVVATVVQMAGQLALFGYGLDILENKPTSMARAFERVRALPKVLLQVLIIYFATALVIAVGAGLGFAVYRLVSQQAALVVAGLYVLALMPLLIYVSIGVVFAMLELCHNPSAGPISSLRLSWRLSEGKRWSIAGVMFVSGLIGGIGVIACCIGVVASAPLGMLLYGALFLALKQPGRPNELPVTQEFPV